MKLRGIAGLLHILAKQAFQYGALRIRCAADQEIVGRVAPILFQPIDIGLKAARGGDISFGFDSCRESLADDLRPRDAFAVHIDRLDLGVVEHIDAKRRCRHVTRVDECLAAAEIESIGAGQIERAGERRLKRAPHSSIQAGICAESRIVKRASFSSVLPPVMRTRSSQYSSSR